MITRPNSKRIGLIGFGLIVFFLNFNLLYSGGNIPSTLRGCVMRSQERVRRDEADENEARDFSDRFARIIEDISLEEEERILKKELDSAIPKNFDESILEELLNSPGTVRVDLPRILRHNSAESLINAINRISHMGLSNYQTYVIYNGHWSQLMVTLKRSLRDIPGQYWTNTTDKMELIVRRLNMIDESNNCSLEESPLMKASSVIVAQPLKVPPEEFFRNFKRYQLQIERGQQTSVSLLSNFN